MGRILFIKRIIAVITGGYGLFYNWYATSNAKFAPVGYHVPIVSEWYVLVPNLGGDDVVGRKIKEDGLLHWDAINDATNESGFNLFGAGIRTESGVFDLFKKAAYLLLNREDAVGVLFYNEYPYSGYSTSFTQGSSIRLIKDDPSTWTEGDTVTDADGNVYQTVKIGTQVWIASNWKCTKWNDGTDITYVSDNAAWAAAVDAGWCYVNGDPNNK